MKPEFNINFQRAFERFCGNIQSIELRAAMDGIKYTDYVSILSSFERRNFLAYLETASRFQIGEGLPPTIYLGLFIFPPSDDEPFLEVAGGSYSRVAITNNATNFPAFSGGGKLNAFPIDFPPASADWGVIAAVGVFETKIKKEAVFFNFLDNAREVSKGDQFGFRKESISFME